MKNACRWQLLIIGGGGVAHFHCKLWKPWYHQRNPLFCQLINKNQENQEKHKIARNMDILLFLIDGLIKSMAIFIGKTIGREGLSNVDKLEWSVVS